MWRGATVSQDVDDEAARSRAEIVTACGVAGQIAEDSATVGVVAALIAISSPAHADKRDSNSTHAKAVTNQMTNVMVIVPGT